ncbi:macrophage mannose receptor 1-like isoform X1 [Dreissena polymorpha]|nr:macrophage mannose receptor 1-like isoform X1 [Dreissena polymorpha]
MCSILKIVGLVTSLWITSVRCDFSCICNYDIEKPVYGQMSAGSAPIGYLYEFDCKPEGLQTANTVWLSIQYEGKYGYLEAGPNAIKQVCPGAPPVSDTVTTTSTSTTATSTTTSSTKSTTNTPSTTSKTITPTTTPTTSTPSTTTTTRTTASTTTLPTTTSTTTTLTTTSTTTTPTTTSSTSTTTTASSTNVPTTHLAASKASTITTPTTTSAPTKPTTTSTTTTSTPTSTTTGPTSRSTTTSATSTPVTSRITTTRPAATRPTIVSDGCGPFRPNVNSNEPGVLFTIHASENKCYEFVSLPKHRWRSAESHCTANNGHLAHIANKQEQDGIYSYVQSQGGHDVWIGLNDMNIEEIFTWVSGDPVTNTNWQDGRFAAFGHNTEDCVILTDQEHNGTWDDRPCDEFHGFVCEYETGAHTSGATTTSSTTRFLTTPLTTIATHTGVPHNGVSAGCGSFHPSANSNEPGVLFTIKASANTCYEFVSLTNLNWWSPESHCTANGGHLVHVSNIQVQDGLNSVVQSHGGQYVWIGLNDINIEEKFSWVSGDPVTITKWKEGRFAMYGHSTEDCVVLTDQSHNWTWDDRPCNEYHGFVCEYSSNTITYGCSHLANIPGNYEPGTLFTVDSRCYELVRTSHTWRVAETNCVNKGGHLASIDNMRQQSGVYKVVRGSGLQNVWIGLHDHDIEGYYSWISCSVAGFTNFITPHTNFHGSQDCVS